MKLVLTLVLAASSAGCMNMPTYDANEYALANSISTISDITQKYCAVDRTKVNRNVEAIYISTMMLKNYTMYRPQNEEVTKLVGHFAPIVEEFNDKVEHITEYSDIYCVAKLQIINTAATSIQEVLGNKPK